MRICFVCNEYPPGRHGGIGTMTQMLARGLVQAGHHVRAVGVYSDRTATEHLDDEGVEIWRLPLKSGHGSWITGRIRLFRQIAAWSKAGEIDLVEVPDWEGWAAGWPRLAVPVIARLHGTSTYFASELDEAVSHTTHWLERRSLRRMDAWCSSSRYTADRTARLFELPREEIEVLHNPTSRPIDSVGATRSSNRVVFTGTLVAKKGIVPLIDAWPRVIARCPEAKLHVYGKDGRTSDGESMTAILRDRLGEHSPSVHFHGHVDRAMIATALQEARLAIFPSFAEAFALAPMEAMAVGCPTIYSRLGSGPELIDEGVNGLLIDPHHPDEISDAILRLLSDDELAATLGANGARHIQTTLSVEQVIGRNVSFYERCVSAFFRRHRADFRSVSNAAVAGVGSP